MALLKDEIKSFFRGDVADDAETLRTYSHDASLFEVTPALVLFPKDSGDVQALVRFVSEKKREHPTLAITARSAGTDMSGGAVGESLILSFTKYMGGIVSFTGNEITVKPGTYYRDMEKETSARGLMLPSFPASKNLCAVGGIVANNAGGEKTLSYGKTERYVTRLKVVLSDGKEYEVRALSKAELDAKMAQSDFEGALYKRLFSLITEHYDAIMSAKPNVSKNSAGYYLWNVWDGKTFDLPKLIVGSQGTLCLVTEVTFKLVPIPKHHGLFVVFLKNLKPLGALVNDVLPLGPESIESYDDHTLSLAMRFFSDLLKTMKVKNLAKLMWQFLPEAIMVLTGGMPKLVLLIECTGMTDEEVAKKLAAVSEKVAPYGLKTRMTRDEEEAEKYWTIRRESFNLLRKHVHGRRTAPFIDDIIVRPEHLPEFMPKLQAILDEYKLLYTVAGHAGDGNFHVIPLMDMHDPKNKKVILEASERVYDLVLSYKGSITAEHNDGIIRTPYVRKMFGNAVYALFEETKRIFDPLDIFNPGKKVEGSITYLRDHLAKE